MLSTPIKHYYTLNFHDGYIHIASAIDNLVKGAAGQAVENMNLMFGLAGNPRA